MQFKLIMWAVFTSLCNRLVSLKARAFENDIVISGMNYSFRNQRTGKTKLNG